MTPLLLATPLLLSGALATTVVVLARDVEAGLTWAAVIVTLGLAVMVGAA